MGWYDDGMTNNDEVRALEAQQAELENEMDGRIDPIDFLGAIQMIADSEDSLSAFLETTLYKDLLHFSQSNPERTDSLIRKWCALDERIAEIN